MSRGRTVVAIHQPNFLPWLGFFDKLVHADVFVLLDTVQFPRTSKGTWINRVKLLVGGVARWVTVPISRSDGSTPAIEDVRVDDSRPWRRKLARTIELNYRRASAFADVFPLVSELLATPDERIAWFNERNVRRLAEALGLDTGKIVRSSEPDAEGQSTELLIELTRAVGGTAYMRRCLPLPGGRQVPRARDRARATGVRAPHVPAGGRSLRAGPVDRRRAHELRFRGDARARQPTLSRRSIRPMTSS